VVVLKQPPAAAPHVWVALTSDWRLGERGNQMGGVEITGLQQALASASVVASCCNKTPDLSAAPTAGRALRSGAGCLGADDGGGEGG